MLSNFYASTFQSGSCIYPQTLSSPLSSLNVDISISSLQLLNIWVILTLIYINKYIYIYIYKTAGGLDGILPIFIKNTACSLTAPLAHLFSISYTNSNFPPLWLLTFIMPILRKGDQSNPATYRSIFLTFSICKITGKIVKESLWFYSYSQMPTNIPLYYPALCHHKISRSNVWLFYPVK